jgi:integrase/recombinase XerD
VTDIVPIATTAVARQPELGPVVDRIKSGWLLRCKSAHTKEAYERDIGRWFQFLAAVGIDVFDADSDHVTAYMRVSEQEIDHRSGQALSPATVARRVAVVSSFYKHARRMKAVTENPAIDVDRPEVDPDHSETAGMTEDEAQRLIAAAELLGEQATTNRSRVAAVRNAAMVVVMLCTGGRISEVTGAGIEDLGYDRGHRVLYVTRKGGKRQSLPLGEAARIVDRHVALSGRTKGPLFITTGGKPVNRAHVSRAIRKAALMAHLPAAAKISPHGLRHTFATLALDGGATLDELQDTMGHADPRTTRRYDRARNRIDRSPVHKVSRALLGPPTSP